MDEQRDNTNISPAFYPTFSLGATTLLTIYNFTKKKNNRERVLLTIYYPWMTDLGVDELPKVMGQGAQKWQFSKNIFLMIYSFNYHY